MSHNYELQVLSAPRGAPGQPPIQLDMTDLNRAEARLSEVSLVSNATAADLMGLYNQSANLASKYTSWLDYEIMVSSRHLDLAKAVVILDKLPEEIQKYKEAGLKANDDFRNALIARDPECASKRQTMEQLMAIRALLEAKIKTFVRAYNSCKLVWERKSSIPVPNYTSTQIGMAAHNLMGAPEHKED